VKRVFGKERFLCRAERRFADVRPLGCFIMSMDAPLMGGPSSSDDPYYAFRDELQLEVKKAATRFARWRNLLETVDTSSSREFKDLHASLRKELSSLQANAADLDQVVQRIQTQRSHFAQISDRELAARQASIREIKNEIDSMRSVLSSPQTQGKIESDSKKSLLQRRTNAEQEMTGISSGANADYIEDQHQQQQLIYREQDDHLDELEQGVSRLGHVATVIGEEIDNQNDMLDDLGDEIDISSGRMESTLQKMDKMLKTNSRCQTWTILSLMGVLFILILLVAWT